MNGEVILNFEIQENVLCFDVCTVALVHKPECILPTYAKLMCMEYNSPQLKNHKTST